MVKRLPAMRETWVHSLGWEDLEKEMAVHSSVLAWRIPWTEEPGGLQSMRLQRVGHEFSSVAQSCPTLCDPMNRSTPGLPVHHQLPEFTQTHVHRVRDAIQPSHPGSSLSPPASNPSQHQSLFQISKFAGILSAAHSQHHLSGFEIAQLECHHLH